jgi:hypothetical protein
VGIYFENRSTEISPRFTHNCKWLKAIQ